MIFSSNIFVFGFLPLFFSLYFLLPAAMRNGFVLIASLLFYTYGAGQVVIVLLISIAVNYAAARIMERTGGKARLCTFLVATALNIGALFYYKYAGFLWDAANDVTGSALLKAGFARPQVELPIGISFFTFQAMSYIADVYTNHCRPCRRLVDFAMYHSLFPQLIAGPIVRYVEVEDQVAHRSTSLDMAAAGAARFVLGLAKKLAIADSAGFIADRIFALDALHLSPMLAWLGAVAYSIQILFDFAGYSDMAIGLGLMMGFTFPENFNAPYQSQNVTEFWRRWHMTLSRWFRDYIYIPLGGNRKGGARTYCNLVIVFFLCGLWHGAGYTFIVWGLYHGALLVIERISAERWNFRPRGLSGRAWTLLSVIVGWVFFRAQDMHQAMTFLRAMAGLGHASTPAFEESIYPLPFDHLMFLALGVVIALVPMGQLRQAVAGMRTGLLIRRTATLLLFFYAALLLSVSTFNPFIYFRF